MFALLPPETIVLNLCSTTCEGHLGYMDNSNCPVATALKKLCPNISQVCVSGFHVTFDFQDKGYAYYFRDGTVCSTLIEQAADSHLGINLVMDLNKPV